MCVPVCARSGRSMRCFWQGAWRHPSSQKNEEGGFPELARAFDPQTASLRWTGMRAVRKPGSLGDLCPLCTRGGFSSLQSRISHNAKPFYDLWATDDLFYKDKILSMNDHSPKSTSEFLKQYPIGILSRLLFSISRYRIRTPLNDS